MSDINREDIALKEAFDLIRKRIETVYPDLSGGKTQCLTSIDLLEFSTVIFSSLDERAGFNDFLGGFTDSPSPELKTKIEWAKGYLIASKLNHTINNKNHFSGCHFDDAEKIVMSVLNEKSKNIE